MGGEGADGVDDEERELSEQTEQWSTSLESQMETSQVGELVRPLSATSTPWCSKQRRTGLQHREIERVCMCPTAHGLSATC